MQTAGDELRDHARRRALVSLETAACAAAATALWSVSGLVQGAIPEAQSVFLTLLLAFGVATVRWIEKLVPVLTFRCPRCRDRFHWNASRAALRIRRCAHCQLGDDSGDDASRGDPAEAPNP